MSDNLIWCDLCSTMVSPAHECEALRFQRERDAALALVNKLADFIQRSHDERFPLCEINCTAKKLLTEARGSETSRTAS